MTEKEIGSTNARYWEVELLGHPSDLAFLTAVYTEPDLRVLPTDAADKAVLQSDRFDPNADHDAVKPLIGQMLQSLAGVIESERGLQVPLKIGAIWLNRGSGRDIFVALEPIRGKLTAGVVAATVTDSGGNVVPQPTPRAVLIERLARKDAAVGKALRLMGSGDLESWVGLFRIYEVIEHDIGGQHDVPGVLSVPPNQVSRFKHSANSVSVGGDQARHGKEPTAPPSDPMEIDEARAFVESLHRKWIDRKL